MERRPRSERHVAFPRVVDMAEYRTLRWLDFIHAPWAESAMAALVTLCLLCLLRSDIPGAQLAVPLIVVAAHCVAITFFQAFRIIKGRGVLAIFIQREPAS